MEDKYLSLVITILGISSLIFGLIVGGFPDRYGIRLALIVGNIGNTLRYLLMVYVDNVFIQVCIYVVFGILGTAFTNPALEAALKYTTQQHYRGIAIAMFGALTYVAALFAGLSIQVIIGGREKNDTTFGQLYYYAAAMSFTAVVLSFFVKNPDNGLNSVCFNSL